MLEVLDLPAGTKCLVAKALLEDLASLGAQLQFQPSDPSQNQTNYPVSQCKVLALFESETVALMALTNHKNPQYKLRPVGDPTGK